MFGSDVPPAQSWNSVSLRMRPGWTDSLGSASHAAQPDPVCLHRGQISERGTKAMRQELGISVGIRNELKDQHVASQSSWICCGRGEGSCSFAGLGKGLMNPWRRGRYLSAELILLCLSQFCTS